MATEMDPTPQEIYLLDPLSPVTRGERRNLLVASVIGLLVAHVGLVPTKITALNVEFSASHQSALIRLLAMIIAYFLFAFLIYASSDLWRWRIQMNAAPVRPIPRRVREVSALRQFWEVGFPLILGIYTFLELWH